MAGLIHDLLEFSAQVKLYHWQTKVYARHVASDKLFGEINSLIDQFVDNRNILLDNFSFNSCVLQHKTCNLKQLFLLL